MDIVASNPFYKTRYVFCVFALLHFASFSNHLHFWIVHGAHVFLLSNEQDCVFEDCYRIYEKSTHGDDGT